MISPGFYNKQNLVQIFLGEKTKHYSVKDASVTLSFYNYQIKMGEDLYTIASRIFGENLEYLWTYIADNNPPRHPDDWHVGDILRLPKVIIRDTDTVRTIYSNVTSTSTRV